ncbi:MAG: hypothetical protein COV45_05435 [Deltaproteobacteria bacterium CG11_big_fil_rev_8_21_14_0_20_47_16]|nr:MAG: hypothetical protein COV45_05435 [Deltaproteobacteria bacterium CG11_big_fil_rev_8_21_14_0_20_47_16]
MAIPAWTRYFRRIGRGVRAKLLHLQVTFHGNDISRVTNFKKSNMNPVLLIQGFGSTRRCFHILEKRLRNDGYDVFTIRIGGWFGTMNTRGVSDVAADILKKLESLRDRFKFGKVAVIGHSKGGIIGRYMVTCLGGNKHVHTLITLGSPHKGHRPASLLRFTPVGLLSKGIRQLRPKSKVIRRMRDTPIPKSVYTVSIGSENDQIVPVQQTEITLHKGMEHIVNIRIKGHRHTDYLVKQQIYNIIKEHLSVGEKARKSP